MELTADVVYVTLKECVPSISQAHSFTDAMEANFN
jgi:hypothetical protein